MSVTAVPAWESESAFAEFVDTLRADPSRREQLLDLLREDHAVYEQRGTATVVRMRGWILLALARTAVPDAALAFVLDELDTGIDPYLVAVAARALRSYPQRLPAFAPFLMHALANVRYRDDPVSLAEYGGYEVGPDATSPVVELLRTLAWLGPAARGVQAELEALGAAGAGLPRKRLPELDRALTAIRCGGPVAGESAGACCALPRGLAELFHRAFAARRAAAPVESAVFEDHDSNAARFDEFFVGQPSIVVFFYTRCDNPLKCSLTVSKLARVQGLLEARGAADRIRTAAITYDPGFDLHDRLRAYGASRGVRMNAHHRMLRAVEGSESLRAHFALGVNFIESLVNRHRVEAYVLDKKGRVAASFERVRWDEEEIVACAMGLLSEATEEVPSGLPHTVRAERGGVSGRTNGEASPRVSLGRGSASPIVGTLASFAFAFFPKCPICWAAYLSFFGIATLERIPYSPWLMPVLAVAMLINVVSVGVRARASGRFAALSLVVIGAAVILAANVGVASDTSALAGVALTLAGSLVSVLDGRASPASRERSYQVKPGVIHDF